MNKYFYFKNLDSAEAKEFIKNENKNFQKYKKSKNDIYQSISSSGLKISANPENVKQDFYSSGNVNIWTTPVTYIIKGRKYNYLYIQYKNRKPISLMLNKGRLKSLEKYQITEDEKRILFFTDYHFNLYVYNIEKSKFEDKIEFVANICTSLYKNSLYYSPIKSRKSTFKSIYLHKLDSHRNKDKCIYKFSKQIDLSSQGNVKFPLYYVVENFIFFIQRQEIVTVTMVGLKNKSNREVIFKQDNLIDVNILSSKDNIYLYVTGNACLKQNNILYKLNFQNNKYIGKNIIIQENSLLLEDLKISKHYFIALVYTDFERKINIYNLDGKYLYTLKTFKWKKIFLYVHRNSDNIYFSVFSFKDHIKFYKCNVKKKSIQLIYQYKTSKNYESSNYKVTKMLVPGNGVNIPIFMLYHKKVNLKNENPLVLDVYGATGGKIYFQSTNNIFTYLNNGGVYVFASLRGNGDLLNDWIIENETENKEITLIDLETVSKFLINEKYTNKNKFIIEGASNGGLTVLVGMLRNPELYKAVVAISPSIDKGYNTNIKDQKYLESKKGIPEWYPFYNKLGNKKYPDVLLNINLEDRRVLPYNGLSFAKKMKSKTNVFLLINKGKNYSGNYVKESPIKDLRDRTSKDHVLKGEKDMFLFIYDQLNLIKK